MLERPQKSKKNNEIINNFDVLTDKKIFLDVLKNIEKKKFIAFDLETTSLDYIKAEIVGISLALDTKISYYIPVGHEEQSEYKQLPDKICVR